MEYKSYSREYKFKVIEIFKSNCPKYFDPNDEKELIEFLEQFTDENYLVVFDKKKIIGCGGHFTKDKKHGIAWTMFERNSIGQKGLLKVADSFFSEIETRINNENKGYDVYVDTTQLLENFFNRYGFKTYQIIQNGFGKGLDEYKMKRTTHNNV